MFVTLPQYRRQKVMQPHVDALPDRHPADGTDLRIQRVGTPGHQ